MAVLAATALLLLAAFRTWLLLGRREDLGDLGPGGLFDLYWTGLRLDGVVVGALSLPLALAVLAVPEAGARGLRRFTCTWAAAVLLLLAAAEVAGLYFFAYYDFRPNYLVLEHGGDREVARAVAAAYPLGRIAVAVVLVAAAAFASFAGGLRLLRRWARTPSWAPLRRWVLPAAALAAAGLAVRGSLDHRPLNPSAASFSANRVANEVAANGVFNVAYAWYAARKGSAISLAGVQKLLPPERALAIARRHLRDGRLLDDGPNPLVRLVENPPRERPLNVVLVVMESFTARVAGYLGGEIDLMPGLGALADEGVVLENCYATGERTVQGLEAAVASIPPLPGESVIRRPEAQSGVDNLATVLAGRGYDTLFLYGGQGIFDQMRGFFLGNGFRTFIEEKDYPSPVYRSSWGVSDEDLFARADAEFRRRHAAGTPFFATLLTVSLHSPFDHPEGRVPPLPADTPVPAGFEAAELQNFLYADWAVAKFLRDARTTPWFDDTLFVLVGDHGVHLRGRGLVPSEEYRVANLLYCPRHLPPRRLGRVASQADLPPTVLGILGGIYRSPFLGEDVLRDPEGEGFATLVYDKRVYGVRSGDRLVVLPGDGSRKAFRVGARGAVTPDAGGPAFDAMGDEALALLQVAETLIRGKRFTAAPHPAPAPGGR